MAEVALITGCATGIGHALALNLHRRSLPQSGQPAFRVFATDYRLEMLKELKQEGIEVARLDVTDTNSIKAAVDTVISTAGRIDLLVCNAGILVTGWLVELDCAAAQRLFDINYFGVLRTVQAVAPIMMDRGSGKIATLCSVQSYGVQPYQSPYCSVKAAVATMTEALCMELEPFGVSVTSIVPAFVKSEIVSSAIERQDWSEKPAADSYYQGIMPRIWEISKVMAEKGISCERAADDIARAMAKPRPPRFVRTGDNPLLFLFAGFLQTWISSWLVARYWLHFSDLHKRQLLGKGVTPPPAIRPQDSQTVSQEQKRD